MSYTEGSPGSSTREGPTLTVRDLEWKPHEVSATVDAGGAEERARFRSSETLSREAYFLLPLLLLPAMRLGVRLDLPEPLSARQLASLDRIQDIFHAWNRESYGKVPVSAKSVKSGDEERACGVACFFSGGVDSFYSVLKHHDRITHLILIHGFDLHLTDRKFRSLVSGRLREAAATLGKTLIEVETDLRNFSSSLVSWEDYHGGALASVALLLKDHVGEVIVPASSSYANLIPWGSHPILDPLWSVEGLEISHDGNESTRVEKIASIAGSEAARKHLRVCFINRGGAYNCGRCEKCLRTMVSMRATGNLGRFETFPSELDLEALSGKLVAGENNFIFLRENLNAVRRFGRDPELEHALSELVRRSETNQLTTLQEQRDRATLLYRAERASRQAAEIRHREAKKQLSRLEKRLARLEARYASRRYRLADAVAEAVLKLPGTKRLLRRGR